MSLSLKRLITSLLVLTAAGAAIAAARVPAYAQDSGPVYVVQSGDSLVAIAQKFGVTVEDLAAANGIDDPATIQPGAELTIPGFGGISGVLTTRPLAFGETLWSVAIRSGQPYSELGRLNRVVHPSRFYVGQAIIMPEGEGGPGALSEGRPIRLQPGQTLLELAVLEGWNPWTVKTWSALGARQWTLESEKLALPSAGRPMLSLPAPIHAIDVDPVAGTQGRTVVITAQSQSPVQVQGRLGEWQLLFPSESADTAIAIQGIHALVEPGLYDLELTFSQDGEILARVAQPFRIRLGGYGFDPILYVPEETLDPLNTRPEDQRLEEVFAMRSPLQLWEGAFDFPYQHFVESFPSVFGTRRNYNETGYNSYHTGLDFYGGTGVEIYAPAAGVVVLADELTVRGNTTILDHGLGIFTMYMHQSEILVEVGQEVARGDLIGLVGGTGRVTGPHLHWEVRAGGIPVDPLEWVERSLP